MMQYREWGDTGENNSTNRERTGWLGNPSQWRQTVLDLPVRLLKCLDLCVLERRTEHYLCENGCLPDTTFNTWVGQTPKRETICRRMEHVEQVIQRSLILKLSMVAHACGPSMKEEMGRSQKLGASLSCRNDTVLWNRNVRKLQFHKVSKKEKRKRRKVSPGVMALMFTIPVLWRLRLRNAMPLRLPRITVGPGCN